MTPILFSVDEEGNHTKMRSYNKRILLSVDKIDQKVNEFRTELENQLNFLIDVNKRRRAWQRSVDIALQPFENLMNN